MGYRVEQIALKPGRYGSDVLTREELEEHVRNTNAMIEAGYSPAVFLEHPPQFSEEGAPKSRRETDIDTLAGAAGWLEKAWIGDDGAAAYALDITDSEIARKLKEGSIRYTSPELRPLVRRGGRLFENVFAHVALTHKPRNIEQSEFREPARQFSLDDWEPIQMAEDDKKPEDEESEGGEPEAEKAPENPDMPDSGNGEEAKRGQRIEAIVAHLAELGVGLPDDTREADIDTLLDRLLTGLKTAALAKKQQEPPEEPEAEEPKVVEQMGGAMQYSIDDAETVGKKLPLLKKVMLASKRDIGARLDAMIGKNKITPAAKEALLGTGSMQFSECGDLLPTMTLEQVVNLLDNCLPENMAITGEQIAQQFSTEDHPDGENHYTAGAEVTPEQAKEINDRLAAKGVLPTAKA